MTKKILYIFDSADWNSRIPVAHAAKEKGFHVIIGLIGDKIESKEFEIINIAKPGKPLAMLELLGKAHLLLMEEKPDILHVVTLKYAFLCGMAALPIQNMRRIYTLAGLGYLFHGHSFKATILRSVLKVLLISLFRRKHTLLIFQNPDDLNLMIQRHYAKPEQCILIRGSGVDLDKFSIFFKPQTPPLVLMPTRLVREKGIHIFIDAAKILKKKGIEAKFQIAGGETKHNPKAISSEEMFNLTRCGAVEWLGRVSDMPRLLSEASLIVYPSYYGEGIPRVLLEACAAGKAIVTTDHTGCREAVTHGVNGLLVPIKNAQATADAIELLLEDTQRRKKMGELSRKLAENEFDIRLISRKTLDVYYL